MILQNAVHKIKHNSTTSRSYAIKAIIKILHLFRFYVHQVTDKIAPGYSAQIKQPMYLSKISEKIRARIYTDMSDMCADVELMFHNCIQFNSSTSSYGKVILTQFQTIILFIELFFILFYFILFLDLPLFYLFIFDSI